jgi:pimeloyl-ACP methyl ester carboxylesterase
MKIVLLPGLACDGELFAPQTAALKARGLDVHVSDVHTRCTSLPEMARTLLAEQGGRLCPVGVSMGGMLALEVQRQAPDRVGAMALLGSTARPDTPELLALRTQACEMFASGRMDEVLRANVPFAFHPANAGDGALVGAYLAMVRRAGPAQLIAQNRAVMARIDSRPLLQHVGCPVLVLCGQADRLTTPEHAEEMAALLPHAELHLLPGAGHMLTMEQPQQVNTLLLAWLQKLGQQ